MNSKRAREIATTVRHKEIGLAAAVRAIDGMIFDAARAGKFMAEFYRPSGEEELLNALEAHYREKDYAVLRGTHRQPDDSWLNSIRIHW